MATKKNSHNLIHNARDLDDAQVNVLTQRSSQEDMVRNNFSGVNKSLDRAKEEAVLTKKNSHVLKESRSHDRDTMLSRVTALGVM